MTLDESRTLLAQWDLTRDWLRYTARPIFGNIIGAPEPPSQSAYVALLLKVTYLPAVADLFNRPSPTIAYFCRKAAV